MKNIIPQDGYTYLAWHRDDGHCLCRWSCFDRLYLFKFSEIKQYAHTCKDIRRWMDEKGQWNEVVDE